MSRRKKERAEIKEIKIPVSRLRHSPRRQRSHGLQGVGVADHLVEVVYDLAELGPIVAVLLPAVQHQLVQRTGTVHWRGEPVVLLYGVDDLQGETQISKEALRRGVYLTERKEYRNKNWSHFF